MEVLEELIKESKNWSEFLTKKGLKYHSQSIKYWRDKCIENKINYSHFSRKKLEYKLLNNILIKDQKLTISTSRLKQILYNNNLKQRNCEICDQNEIWNGKKMSLILDHIDGDTTNNLIENLRIVCPNCNATLDTFAGKNKKNDNIKKILESNVDFSKPFLEELVNLYGGSKQSWYLKVKQLERKGLLINVFKYRKGRKEGSISKSYKKLDISKILNYKEDLLNIVQTSQIDFTKVGWGVKLGKLIDKSPQHSLKLIKKYIPNFYKDKCFKHKS